MERICLLCNVITDVEESVCRVCMASLKLQRVTDFVI